jgi:outer membrane protein assembly factor BamB
VNRVRSSLLSSLVLACALGAVGCGDATRHAAGKPTTDQASSTPAAVPGALRALKDTPFERSWDLDLKKPVSNAWILPEIPETVFFQLAGSNEIVAVDALSGHTRWVSIPFAEPLKLAPGACRVRIPGQRPEGQLNDDRLYLVAEDVLFVLDGTSGQIIWRYTLPFSPSTAPKAVGIDSSVRIFLGDWAGRLQVVSYDLAKSWPYVAWQTNLGTAITAPLVEHDDLVYLADSDGVVHCFKLERQQVWSFAAGGHIDGAPVVRDRDLFVGTSDHILYALDRLTGEKLGQCNLNAPLKGAPFVFRNDPARIYAWIAGESGKPGGIYAFLAKHDTVAFTDTARHPLDVVRLGLEWQLAGVDTLVASTPGYLYATAGNSTVVQAINRQKGVVDWTWDVNAERRAEQLASGIRPGQVVDVNRLLSYQDPTDANRSIFAIDERGGVVAYRFFGYVPDSAVVAEPVASTPMKGEKADKGEKPAKPAAP